jgi:ubiquinone/menaquinone biosynthesis C-methylase UbiE
MQNNSYVFGHSQPEIERLRRQAEMLRPITQRLLISAGLEKGMRVLDIGCGPGDVTMLAADLVGPTGRVVGIDRDEAVIGAARQRISELGFSNVEFAQHDVETYDGPAGFDVAVCRYVLIHQTDPVRFLQVTRGLVRSGGVIALHEMDTTRGVRSSPCVPLLHQMEALALAAFKQAGTAGDAGGRLVQLCADAGLPAPRLFAETIVESGEEAMLLPWVTDTLRQVLPRLIATGVATEDDIEIDTLTERLQRAAVELRSQLELVPQMCGWTRV